MRGYLQITFGPMFSGKTTRLISSIHKYLDVNEAKGSPKKGMIINSSLDERISKSKVYNLTSHSSQERKIREDIVCCKVNKLKLIDQEMLKDFDFIAVDEAQFFSDLEIVNNWVESGKYVHVSGLIADTNRQIFGDLIKLFPLADDVEQLKAYCVYCSGHEMNAPFTRTKETTVLDRLYPGSYETYVPVCGKHL